MIWRVWAASRIIGTQFSILSRSFGYDAIGNITSDANGGTAKTYTYNHANRLSAVNENGASIATFTYNAHNQLLIRSVTSGLFAGTTVYIYDLEGHVIAEYDAVPQRLRKEYVWLNDTPLALIDHSTGTPCPLLCAHGSFGPPQSP